MNRQEWTERTGSTPTPAQWDVVERIYSWHPALPEIGSKDILADKWLVEYKGREWPESSYGCMASHMLAEANASAAKAGASPVLDRRETFCTRYHVVDRYVKDETGKPVSEVFAYVKEQLKNYGEGHEEYGGIIDEYFHSLAAQDDGPVLWPFKARWIAVYAVTGGSEGHYVHVDALENDEKRTNLFLAKTFRGYDHAIEIVRVLGKILEV